MIQRRSRTRFLLEARHGVGLRVVMGGDRLESDLAPEAGVARAIDFAHAAGAEALNNFVGPKARGCGHRRSG